MTTFLKVFGLMFGAGLSAGSIMIGDLHSLYSVLGFLLMAVFMGWLLMDAARALGKPQPTAIERVQVLERPKRIRKKSTEYKPQPVNVAFVKRKKEA